MIYLNRPDVTIYNDDFRDVIGEISKDALVITDPPYNINFKYDVYKDRMPDDKYIEMLSLLKRFKKIVVCQYPIETMKYIVPALGVPEAVSAWCYNSNIPNRFRLVSYYGCKPNYSKVKQPYKNPTDKRVAELIKNGSNGTNLYEWWTDIQLVKNVSQVKGKHPCPVPEKLQERIITLCAQDGDVIFDPFAGGLTTIVSAKKLGYKSIGCELSLDYIKDGLERLSFLF